MIIDASFGRANCCGMPQPQPQPFPPQPFPPQPFPPQPFPPQPFPPQPFPPIPPQGAVPDSIQVQLAAAQTGIATGAVIPLSAVLRQTGTGLTFNAGTSAVTVSEAGVYVFDWQVLVQTAEAATADPIIALQSLDGQTVLGYTGTLAANAADGILLSGHTVAALPAGSTWVLVNASGEAINIPLAGTAPAAFAASLIVYELAAPTENGRQPRF